MNVSAQGQQGMQTIPGMSGMQDMQSCIESCNRCYQVCLQTAMNYCLETGGNHVEPSHFRLMMNCAAICETSAGFMLSGSEHHRRVCGVCAEICEACADDCERLGDNMDECVEVCRACASSCRQMAEMH